MFELDKKRPLKRTSPTWRPCAPEYPVSAKPAKAKTPARTQGFFQFQRVTRGGIDLPTTKQPEGCFVASEMMAKATDY